MRPILILSGLVLAAVALAMTAWWVMQPDDEVIPDLQPEDRHVEIGGEPVGEGQVPVAGRVKDEVGRPVPGADVYLLEPGNPLVPLQAPLHGRTDEEGRFALAKPRNETFDLIAFRPGFRSAILSGVAAGTAHILVLPRGREIRGRVVDDLDRPLIGVSLIARSEGAELDPPKGIYLPHHETFDVTYARTLTRMGGAFIFTGIGSGPILIEARKRGYPKVLGPTRFDPEKGGEPRIVILRPFIASVRVIDQESGEGVARVSVKIEMSAKDKPTTFDGETDYSGVAREKLDFPAARAPDERVKVTIFSDEHGESVADGVPLDRIEEGRDFTMTLTRRDPAILRIRVTYDTGKPYSSWLFFELKPSAGDLIQRWARVEKEGYATIKAPPGAYEYIRLRTQGRSQTRDVGSIVLRSGDDIERTITIERGGDLMITFRGAENNGLRRGQVVVRAGVRTETRGIWGDRVYFQNLPVGPAQITVTHDAFNRVEKTVDLIKDERVDTEIRVTRRKP